MSALTLRLPDQKHQPQKEQAKSKGMTANHLLDEVTALILAEFDLKTQFVRVQRALDKTQRGLELLEKANKLTC